MYPISAAAKALYEAEQAQVLRITGTDKNGTSISITDADIMENSFSIDRYCCNGSKLEIGTAISAELNMKLNNSDGRFNDVVFEGTELFVEIGIADWSLDDPTVYWMPCGYFTPDEQPRRRDIITISALDRMQLFDRLATDPYDINWTTNNGYVMTDNNDNTMVFNTYVAAAKYVRDIIIQICDMCGVTLGADISFLPNARYTITSLPKVQTQTNFRNLIQWCAGIMGTNAWIDWNGELRFGTYNFYNTDYESVQSNRYSSDYQENDLTITGVQFTNAQNVVIVSGSAEYALDLKGNLLAAPYVAEILPVLRDYYVGYTYRPFSASAVNAPYLWPMDKVTFTDKDGNEYQSVLTNVNFGINCTTWIESVGETEQTNKNLAPSSLTPEQAQLITEAINATEDLNASLNQESIFNRLTNNGEAQGIYMQNGKLYINLTYARAGTLVLGGLDNQNGLLLVRNSNDDLIGSWGNDGLFAKGDFTSQSTNGAYIVEITDGVINLLNNNTVIGTITWSDADRYRPRSVVISGNTSSVESTASKIIADNKDVNLVCTNLTMTQLDSSGDYVIHHNGFTGDLQFDDLDGITHIVKFLNGIVWSVS